MRRTWEEHVDLGGWDKVAIRDTKIRAMHQKEEFLLGPQWVKGVAFTVTEESCAGRRLEFFMNAKEWKVYNNV